MVQNEPFDLVTNMTQIYAWTPLDHEWRGQDYGHFVRDDVVMEFPKFW